MTAAREAFAELGLDMPLEDIARRAGVGIGTLYRRYPTLWGARTWLNRPDLRIKLLQVRTR